MITKRLTRCFVFMMILGIPVFLCGQNPQQSPPQTAPRPAMSTPKKGPCPLPILPALPAYSDSGFFARKEVPHGKIEQVNYKTTGGKEKRMHVYLPPDYESSDRRYPVLYLNHVSDGSGYVPRL